MSAYLNISHMAPVMRMGRHEMWYYPNNGTYMYRERGNHQRRFIKEGNDLRKFLAEMDAKTGVYGAFTAWMKRIVRDTNKIHQRYRASIMLHHTRTMESTGHAIHSPA